MTAEIAVMNRTAVALAADSATTLETQYGAKANNNADKLFHLCHTQPVGLMIFGNAEFLDRPFEPIIKEYRKTKSDEAKETLQEYADSFFAFLESEVEVDSVSKDEYVSGIFRSVTAPIFTGSLDIIFRGKTKRGVSLPDRMAEVFCEQIKIKIDDLETKTDCDTMSHISAEDLSLMYSNLVDKQLQEITSRAPPRSDLLQQMQAMATEYLGKFLKKSVFSESSTGIAFAGFGTKDQFPSLIVYDTEGIVAGKLKRSVSNDVRISPTGTRGHIAALAQDDVVKRYVEGIDPRISRKLEREIKNALAAFGDELANSWVKINKKNAKAQVAAAATVASEKFIKGIMEKLCENERKEITDLVHHMSKLEMAQLAEALVEMTALRRRVSMNVETVGGPIDVAVISKGDGFVWIKRKHYFEPKLNPRYFAAQEHLQKSRSLS